MRYKGRIALGIVVVLGLSIIGAYNGLVSGRQAVTAHWSQVETQYQRRFDLIPNLVEATKGYLQQERVVFASIADARTHYAGTATGSPERVAATQQVDGALGRLLVIIENYPQLKSNETVRGLMDELAGTENRVNVARQRYNEFVQSYNTMLQQFPTNLIARMGAFEAKPFYEAQPGTEIAPKVNLSLEHS